MGTLRADYGCVKSCGRCRVASAQIGQFCAPLRPRAGSGWHRGHVRSPGGRSAYRYAAAMGVAPHRTRSAPGPQRPCSRSWTSGTSKRITATIQIPQNRLGAGRGLPAGAGILAGRASRRRQRLRGDGRGSAQRRRARRRPAHRSGQPSTLPGPSGRPASGFPSPSSWAVPGPLSITRSSNRGTPSWSSSCGRCSTSPPGRRLGRRRGLDRGLQHPPAALGLPETPVGGLRAAARRTREGGGLTMTSLLLRRPASAGACRGHRRRASLCCGRLHLDRLRSGGVLAATENQT